MNRWMGVALATLAAVTPVSAGAVQIAVTNYGSSVTAMPWAVALEKGFFQKNGADVTAIIGSPGGSTEVRNLIAGDLPYADSALISTLKAIKGGSDLRVIADNTHTTAQFVWVAKPDSPIASLADLKGRRITFTTPLSTSQALDFLLVQKAGLKPADVRLISTGAYGAAMTALGTGGVDLALLSEPAYSLNKDKFKPVFWSRDLFGPINSSIGVTSAETAAEHPELLRGIVAARRQAVRFMHDHRDESAAIIGKVYKMEPAVIRQVLDELIDHPSVGGTTFFGEGEIDSQGLDALVDISQATGDLPERVDWRPYVDQSFLPPDLRRKLD